MLENSVIRQSGQAWKLIIAILALLIGSFAPLYAASGISWTTGSVIAVAGYAFGVLAIRCANCGSRWFWEAALGNSGYGQLFSQSKCPKCGTDYSEAR
jgi:hypothetical protein